MSDKIYTEKNVRIHTIVRCAQGKGLTGIVLRKHNSPLSAARGWYMTCNQFTEKHFQFMTAKQVCKTLEAGILVDDGKSFKFNAVII